MSATSFGRQASELSDRVKTVHDPVHGGIRVDGFFLEIMDRHEMQRLRGVKQLGMGNFVFPGANHTRFEHCLGTYYLAGRMAKAIGLSEEDSLAVRTAAMMHDICHAPFSQNTKNCLPWEECFIKLYFATIDKRLF